MLTTEKTVGHVLLVLPDTPQPCLYLFAVGHFAYLLEFIYADDDTFSFPHGNLLDHSEHLFRRMRLRCYP